MELQGKMMNGKYASNFLVSAHRKLEYIHPGVVQLADGKILTYEVQLYFSSAAISQIYGHFIAHKLVYQMHYKHSI